MDEMEKMGTIIALTEDEVKILLLNPTISTYLASRCQTSSSPPFWVLRDSTSRVPNVGGVFSAVSSLKSPQGSTLAMVSPAY